MIEKSSRIRLTESEYASVLNGTIPDGILSKYDLTSAEFFAIIHNNQYEISSNTPGEVKHG